MPADDERLISPDELGSVLERYEGPSRPRRRAERVRSRLGLRSVVLVAVVALLVGSGLGFGVGSSITPSGDAASGVAGLSFVPYSGWTVVQTGVDATPSHPAYAIAANVPLHAADASRRVASTGLLPYATLLGLPPRGAVIVATFTVPTDSLGGVRFPPRALPLRLRDAAPFIENAVQLRPERPLGEYQLRAHVGGRDVDLHFYFGTRRPSKAVVEAAQRQLDRLLVRPTGRAEQVDQRAQPLRHTASPRTVAAPTKVVDRTFSCKPGVDGAPIMDVSASSGYRKGRRFERLAAVTIATVGSQFARDDDYLPSMAGVTAGWPPPAGIASGGLGVHLGYCSARRASVPLTRRGLPGGSASQFETEARCLTPPTVLLRIRAVYHAPTTLQLDPKTKWLSGNARITSAQIAVRTLKGRPLVYGELAESGRAVLYTSCV